MKIPKTNKRGFTLVELCIVMALISVVAVLMTSFMAVFQTRTAQNTARHDFLDEVALVREQMGKWVEYVDVGVIENGVTLTVTSQDENGNIICRYNGEVLANRVSFNEGVLKFFYDVSETPKTQLSLKAIKEITLKAYSPAPQTDPENPEELLPTASNSGKLLLCTLTGEDAFGTKFSQNLIFALDSTARFENKSAAEDAQVD